MCSGVTSPDDPQVTAPRILCFQHCRRDRNIFCFELPSNCTLCGADLSISSLRIPPFQIPSPFSRAKKCPCSIVLKPTNGDFLTHYRGTENLHIGITDSNGHVTGYDEDGVTMCYDGIGWERCLPITIRKSHTRTWRSYWNNTLIEVAIHDDFDYHKYDQEHNNCFSFVLAFVRALRLQYLEPSLVDKTQFCNDLIVPCTRVAAKYISLFREVQANGVHVATVES